MSAVYGVIRKLGATSKYKGYYYVVDAVEMAQKIYERPVKVTKDQRYLSGHCKKI